MRFNRRRAKSSTDKPVTIGEWLHRRHAQEFVTRTEFVNVNTIMLDTFRDRYFLRYRVWKWCKRQWRQLRREASEIGQIAAGTSSDAEE